MVSREDYASGDREPVGARVDGGIYAAFREWVEEQTGKQYAEVGRALDRAMLEYMTDDRIQDQLGTIDEQTKKNEALLRKVLTELDGATPEKEKGKTSTDAPRGKSPGDRKEREMHVIAALLRANVTRPSNSDIRQVIKDVAGVKSEKTVKSYLKAITGTKAFTPARGNRWELNPEGARELLGRHGIPVDGTEGARQ